MISKYQVMFILFKSSLTALENEILLQKDEELDSIWKQMTARYNISEDDNIPEEVDLEYLKIQAQMINRENDYHLLEGRTESLLPTINKLHPLIQAGEITSFINLVKILESNLSQDSCRNLLNSLKPNLLDEAILHGNVSIIEFLIQYSAIPAKDSNTQRLQSTENQNKEPISESFLDSSQYHLKLLIELGKSLLMYKYLLNENAPILSNNNRALDISFFSEIGKKFIDRLSGKDITFSDDFVKKMSLFLEEDDNENLCRSQEREASRYVNRSRFFSNTDLLESLSEREKDEQMFKDFFVSPEDIHEASNTLSHVCNILVNRLKLSDYEIYNERYLFVEINYYVPRFNDLNDLFITTDLYHKLVAQEKKLPEKKRFYVRGQWKSEQYTSSTERLTDYIEKNVTAKILETGSYLSSSDHEVVRQLIETAAHDGLMSPQELDEICNVFNVNLNMNTQCGYS